MVVLKLKIFKKSGCIDFDTPIVFTEQLPENGVALLGEMGFFDHLSEVTFYYSRGKIILQDN